MAFQISLRDTGSAKVTFDAAEAPKLLWAKKQAIGADLSRLNT
jgi:hypothetical protein